MLMPMQSKLSMLALQRMLLIKMEILQLPSTIVMAKTQPHQLPRIGCPVYFKRYEPTFRNKLITYKQQLQRIPWNFIGFPENSAGWLVYSPDHPQRIITTRDAYFDEDFSSALAFDSKPFAGAIPIRSHMDPNGLENVENSEPTIIHQTGSVANLGINPSSFIEEPTNNDKHPPPTETIDNDDDTDDDDLQPGPTPPAPQLLNLTHHQKRHTPLQKEMTLYFQECAESPPSIDPIHTAMLALDASADSSTENDDPVDKYLPEPQSFQAVLKLDDDIRSAWLHAIKMEIKNLIDHGADFIGAYLQAKVIGRHFVILPLYLAYHFPEYAKYFGVPLLLDKGIYGLVYSGKYWNIEFSEWLYSQGFIQSQAEPSYFVYYDKHNQWLRLLFFVDDMLYVGSNDSIEKSFEDSVRNRFDVKFLGPAQWFLQMRIHRHKDSTYTLDQHRYVLNALQRYDPDSNSLNAKLPSHPITSSPKITVLLQTCKACICPGELDFRALIWLFGYLRRRPSYALKFYPDGTSNPIYSICAQHSIPYSDLTVFSDASWQDCPDTGRSTVGYMIFHNGALIEANSTMPTPIAMSTSEAEYMAACSATMATAHIRMLLYDMTYLGTKQWRESSQRLPTIPSVLMIDNEATVQIAKNGKLTRKTRHIERRFHFVRQGQQDGTHQLYWIPCDSQLADILTKTQTSSKIDPHLDKIFCKLPDHLLSPSPISTEI
ncbi:Mitochondrial protein [Fragilaria crotonensis]|nr:Mitochondrial protein [Fragilaria crotonensis]